MTLQIRAKKCHLLFCKKQCHIGNGQDNDEQNEQSLWLTTPLNKFSKMLHLY